MMKEVAESDLKSEPELESESRPEPELPVGPTCVTEVPDLQYKEYRTGPAKNRLASTMPMSTSRPEDLLASVMTRPRPHDGMREHDAETTYLLSVVSAWSYAGPEQLLGMLKRLFPNRDFTCKYMHGYNDALFVDANVYILEVDEKIPIATGSGRDWLVPESKFHIVCFEGTELRNFMDWLIDAGTSPRQFQDLGKVHDGMYRNVQSIALPLRKLIRTILEEVGEHQVLFCGHSLGAAMAILSAAMLWFDQDASLRDLFRRALLGVYTYGSPAVADATFAESCKGVFADLVFRHVYKNDIVPRLPPRTTGDYVHIGKLYTSGEQGWVRSSTVGHTTRFGVVSNVIGLSAVVANTFWFSRWLVPYLPFSWLAHEPKFYILTSRIQECQNLFG